MNFNKFNSTLITEAQYQQLPKGVDIWEDFNDEYVSLHGGILIHTKQDFGQTDIGDYPIGDNPQRFILTVINQ